MKSDLSSSNREELPPIKLWLQEIRFPHGRTPYAKEANVDVAADLVEKHIARLQSENERLKETALTEQEKSDLFLWASLEDDVMPDGKGQTPYIDGIIRKLRSGTS